MRATRRMSYRRPKTQSASLASVLPKTRSLAAVSSIRFVRLFVHLGAFLRPDQDSTILFGRIAQ